MKKLTFVFLIVTLFTITTQIAIAQDRGLGVGAAIGGPDGMSYKYWLGGSAALSGLVSFAISENNSRFYTHLDILNHKFYDELDWDVGRMFYYYGGGFGFEWIEWTNDNIFMLRLPSGIGFNFNDMPVGLFLELAPTVDVSPEFHLHFNGNIGFRYFLN